MNEVQDNFVSHVINQTFSFKQKTLYYQLDDNAEIIEKVTYTDLLSTVKHNSVEIQQIAKKGDRCLLILPPGLDFIVGFLSCLFAGVIPVPLYPPKRNKANERFWSILEDAKPKCMLVNDSTEELVIKHFGNFNDLQKLHRILINHTENSRSKEWTDPPLTSDDIAFLQYTSGSTGKPKCVMVSHANLINNSEIVKQSFGHDENLVSVGWLPPYHDMGLIGTLLQPLYVGGCNYIINPKTFLRSPFTWLKAISKYKGTTVGGPNFALDYCVQNTTEEQKRKINLSSIKVYFCGSEPIRIESLKNFKNSFKKCGFTLEKFLPCYGLAESTLMVTGINRFEFPTWIEVNKKDLERSKEVVLSSNSANSLKYVSSGYTWLDTNVVIVDPLTKNQLDEREIGEIWISGSSVGKGYWNDKKETELTFNAFTTENNGPFLRTGDLGFIHKNHLYVSGRSKDMIIIRGINYYPQEIEHSVENAHDALQLNAAAAFSIDINEIEGLVVINELKRTALRDFNEEEVFKSIQSKITTEHQIQARIIVLISPGSLPRTTSGKTKRYGCKEAYLTDNLKVITQRKYESLEINNQISPTNEITKTTIQGWLINWVSNKLNLNAEDIDPQNPIMSYGLDSIAMVELEREVSNQFKIKIELSDFLENNTISDLAKLGYEMLDKKTN